MTLYNFVDTMGIQAEDSLPSEAIFLDEVSLDKTCTGYSTLSVSGREDLDFDLRKEDGVPGIDGDFFISKRQPAREITVNFLLEAPDAVTFASYYRLFKAALIGNARKISFADEPDKYYIGTLSHIEKPDSGVLRVISSFTLFCPYPHATSFTADEVTSFTYDSSDSYMSATIENNGTLAAFPVFKIRMKSSCGYIKIESIQGDITANFEIGNPQGGDTEGLWKNNDVFLIDMGAATVMLNGSNDSKQVYATSNFLSLPAGVSELRFYFSSYMTEQPDIDVSFRKRWI